MSALDRFAIRCSAEPTFLAFVLATYQRRHGLTDERLADELGCSVAMLTRVRLCGLPRAVSGEVFAADCRSIAERFGLRVEVLERIAWPW